MRTIQVKVSYNTKSGCAMAIGGVILLGLAGLVINALINGADLSNSGPALGGLAAFGLVWFLIPLVNAGERNRHVRTIDINGVTTYGGAKFSWQQFHGIREVKTRLNSGVITSGYSLVFANGAAQIENKMVSNQGELGPVLHALFARDFQAFHYYMNS